MKSISYVHIEDYTTFNRWVYHFICVFSFSAVSDSLQACQIPLFKEFSRQEYWSRLPFYPESESESEVVRSCLIVSTPWTVAHKAPPPMEFSRQEYWSGFPFPSPGDLPDPWILSRGSSQPRDQTHLCISCIGRQIFFTTSATWEVHTIL